LLVIERWHRIHIVFDIHNPAYNPENAHLADENDLSVVAVYIAHDEVARPADEPLEMMVNRTVRSFHDNNVVGSRPPFYADHANGKVPT
jgi:hypothetical protein